MTADMNTALAAPKDIEALLAQPERTSELDALLAETGISRERFTRTVIHALAKSPDVMKASRGSILLAVLDAARMGLEPTGAYGGGYLIRRGGAAVFEVDWRGFIRMGMREGAISRATADLVYEGDEFDYRRGTDPYINHVPTLGPDRGQPDRGHLTHAYAVVWLPSGERLFEVMTLAELNAIMERTSSKKDGRIVGPWVSDPGEMYRKTVVRRVFKYIPAVYNPSLQFALEREDELAPLDNGEERSRPRLVGGATSRIERLRGALTGAEPNEEAAGGTEQASADASATGRVAGEATGVAANDRPVGDDSEGSNPSPSAKLGAPGCTCEELDGQWAVNPECPFHGAAD